jgi:amidase
MRDWAYASAADTVRALASRQLSSLELTQAVIARVERFDPALNALPVRDFERALAAARAADARIAAGESAPLLGVPMTIKESFDLAGTPTTWGFAFAAGNLPGEDALAVQRLKTAGAVIVGKTNVPQALADWQSYNPVYGVTNNPYDTSRTPGGSSGGSAVALVAGYGTLSLGSDIGGSLRAPAHFCGVAAHKPTWGLAPTRGHTPPFAPVLPGDIDFAAIGPMARHAADLALALDVIAGPDPLTDGVGFRLSLPPARHAELRDYRLLVLVDHPLMPTGAAVKQGVARVAEAARQAGATVECESGLLPDLVDAAHLFMRLYRATLSAALPPDVFAGIEQAARALPADAAGLDAERLRGSVLSHRDWIMADGRRRMLQAQWRALFARFDAVICPVMPTPAYPHDHSPDHLSRVMDVDGVTMPYIDMLLWPSLATLPNLPATSLPAGLSPDGLPVGVQIIGPWLEDRTTLQLATLLERELGGFAAPAGYA